MEYTPAILTGFILISIWGLFTVAASLNKLKGILASMSASADKMEAIAKRMEHRNSRS